MNLTSILIVDDSAAQRCALARGLERSELEIAEIRGVATACEAIDALTDGAVDIVLCDASLPDRDGLDLLELIAEACADTACILLTQHGSDELAGEARARGARATLARPFGNEGLNDMIRKLTGRKGA